MTEIELQTTQEVTSDDSDEIDKEIQRLESLATEEAESDDE
jgi:hypothetical protein